MSRQSQIKDFERITFKVVVVGNAGLQLNQKYYYQGVGKSCLIQKYTTKEFQENYQMTIGMDFVSKAVDEVFKSLVKSFYKGAAGIILVYSITDIESFQALKTWAQEINENVPETCLKVIIGSQNDREQELDIFLSIYQNLSSRRIQKSEGMEFQNRHNFQLFFETSALTGENVDEVFEDVAKQIYKLQMQKLQSATRQQQELMSQSNISEKIRTPTRENNSQSLLSPIHDIHQQKQKQKKQCC